MSEREGDPLEALLIDDLTAAEMEAFNKLWAYLDPLSHEKRVSTLIVLAYWLNIGPEDEDHA